MSIARFFQVAAVGVLIMSGSLIACTKSAESPINIDDSQSSEKPAGKTIEGKWVGRYGFDSAKPKVYYSFHIKAGGILEEFDESGLKISEGTWKLDNDMFHGKTHSLLNANEYSVTATFHLSQGLLKGNWGYYECATDGGTWYMDKQ